MIRQTLTPYYFTKEEREEVYTWESTNGVRFFFRLGLNGTVMMENTDNGVGSASKTYTAITEFIAWHRGEIYARLNGFNGYDLVKYSF